MELKVKRIIARANGPQQRMILEKMGVKEILSPENEVGRAIVESLLNPNVLSFLELPDDYEIVEIKAPARTFNKTIEEISMRDKYQINLVTIKREFDEKKDGEIIKAQHVLGVANSETMIYDTDTLVVFGRIKDIERFLEVN